MNGNDTPRTLSDWLRDAYTGCPPPESFLPEEMDALPPAERRRLAEHAERCAACSAERELAQLFAEGPGAPGVRREDVDFVVSKLEAKPAGRVVPFAPSRTPRTSGSPRRSPALLRLAAAAVVILAAGLFAQRLFLAPPPLPAPSVESVLRGGEVELLSPRGEVAAAPTELAWEPRPGASSYRVRLLAFDGAVLWEGTVAAPPARLPAAVAVRLEPAVTYSWTVEASDAQGRRLAGSEPARFRVRRPAGMPEMPRSGIHDIVMWKYENRSRSYSLARTSRKPLPDV